MDYDEYFGIVMTTIESETCQTTYSVQSNDIVVSRVNSFTFQLFEETLETNDSESEIQAETGNVDYYFSYIDQLFLYDFYDSDWCSAPSSIVQTSEYFEDIPEICGLDFDSQEVVISFVPTTVDNPSCPADTTLF